MTARVRSTVAAAESRVASAVSTVDCGVLPWTTSVFWRASVASAFLQLGEAVREVRLLDRIVDVDEQRAGFDVLARIRNDWR